MTATTQLIETLDDLLEPQKFDDYGPNGLQVPGVDEVSHVVTGVTGSRALIERALELDAQMVLAHHGLFWKFHPVGLSKPLAERLRLLFRANVNFAAYHLPLDAHPEVGNNALLAQALGCTEHVAFGDYNGQAIGRAATFADDGIAIDELVERVARVTGREPLCFRGGPAQVKRIGIVSGGAPDVLPQAITAGFDAFLTGEPREHIMSEALESGIHFFAAGHYATETFGVRKLGDLLAERFGIQHTFVDIPNPV